MPSIDPSEILVLQSRIWHHVRNADFVMPLKRKMRKRISLSLVRKAHSIDLSPSVDNNGAARHTHKRMVCISNTTSSHINEHERVTQLLAGIVGGHAKSTSRFFRSFFRIFKESLCKSEIEVILRLWWVDRFRILNSLYSVRLEKTLPGQIRLSRWQGNGALDSLKPLQLGEGVGVENKRKWEGRLTLTRRL